MQAVVTTLITLSVLSILAINPISLRAEGRRSLGVEKGLSDNGVFFLLDEAEYTYDIYGAQIFPNDQLKYSILTEQHQSVYNISSLTCEIRGHTVKASNVQIHVQLELIDDTKTRLNI